MATKKKAAMKKKAPRKAVAKKAPAKKPARKQTANRAGPDVPNLFRINIEVGNLDEAAEFYASLFGVAGRKQAGSRCYFNAGAVTLQVVDVSSAGKPHPAAKALYFATADLDLVHGRANDLGCLSDALVHGTPAGEAAVRPWGERSFYAEDPWGNSLCFVDEGTIYEAVE